MQKIIRDTSKLWIILLGVILFTFTLCVFFPGSYSIDSWSQYNQIITGKYDDWFGSGLPFTWRLIWLATGKYFGLYFMQMLLYWTFVIMLVWQMNPFSINFWMIIVLSIFFCFIPQYIMRDSLMALSWGIAAILLLHKLTGSNKKFVVVIAILFFGYGLWIRSNAIVAIIPLIWASILYIGKDRFAVWQHFLLSVSFSVFLFIVTQLVTYNVLHTAKAYPTYKLKLLDITGISKLSGENYIPGCISSYPAFSYNTLMINYTPATFDNIYWPENNKKSIVPFPDAELNKCVKKSWLQAIINHPLQYLQNRGTGFLYYLHILKRFKSDEYWNVAIWIDPNNPVHLQMKPNKFRDKFCRMYNCLNPTCFYDPWFWLLLNVIGFTYFIFQSRKFSGNFWQINACIQLSGIIFILSQFSVYQHDRDFRYTYWNVFVGLIAISSLFSQNIKKFTD